MVLPTGQGLVPLGCSLLPAGCVSDCLFERCHACFGNMLLLMIFVFAGHCIHSTSALRSPDECQRDESPRARHRLQRIFSGRDSDVIETISIVPHSKIQGRSDVPSGVRKHIVSEV